jgi:hypothetical protein
MPCLQICSKQSVDRDQLYHAAMGEAKRLPDLVAVIEGGFGIRHVEGLGRLCQRTSLDLTGGGRLVGRIGPQRRGAKLPSFCQRNTSHDSSVIR